MLQERLARAPRAARLSVRLAANADELRQAQKLRYRIFGEEMGAQLASAQATLAKANADVTRYKPLVAADAISKQEFDNAGAAEQAARAEVLAGQAAVRSAQINVG